jgi:ankyrin repeat protein
MDSFIIASLNNDKETVECLLSNDIINPSPIYAAGAGHHLIVEIILRKSSNLHVLSTTGLQLASRNGHTKVIQCFLNDKRVDPSSDDNFALRLAFTNNHSEVVAHLLNDERVKTKLTKDESLMKLIGF